MKNPNHLSLHRFLVPLMSLSLFVIPLPAFSEDDEEDHEEEFSNPLNLTESEVIQFLSEKLPEAAEELEMIRAEEGEDIYQEDLRYAMMLLTEYRHTQQEDPKQAEAFLLVEQLEYQVHSVADGVWESESETERDAATLKLREKIGELIDAQLGVEEMELAALEREVAELRSLLQQKKSARKESIDLELAEILDDDEEEDDDEDDDDEEEDEDDEE